jgi:hypothetical protein
MPAYWNKKVKREKIICLTPVLLVFVMIVIFIGWAYFVLPYDNDYSDLYVDREDIIPTLHEETYNAMGQNDIDMSLKIYVTNWGTVDSGDVFIELYVMKNGTARADAKSSEKVVKSERTEIFELTVNVIVGEYQLQILIWDDKMVVYTITKNVRITPTDIEDQSDFDIDYDDDYAEGKAMSEEEGMSFLFGPFIAIAFIAVLIILLIGFVLYKARTTMPAVTQPPPTQYPVAYPQTGYPQYPRCPHCGAPVTPGAKTCERCKKAF